MYSKISCTNLMITCVNFSGFLFFSSLTTFHFFCAMCDGPGYLPLEWKPDNEKESQYLQFCDTCQVLPV